MEVKTIYMDLIEGVKKGNGVWRLESEAFKKPIEIKIGYDNQELTKFNNDIEGIRDSINKLDRKSSTIVYDQTRLFDIADEHSNKIKNKQIQLDELREKIEEQKSEISSLYKVIADLKTMVETQSGTILHLQESIKQIQQKITKQPSVYSDKTFISGHERVGLGMIDDIPGGDYLVITKYTIGEHNEYVKNQNDIVFSKEHISGTYVPFYQLVGGTELDNPTATVYRDLVLIPC